MSHSQNQPVCIVRSGVCRFDSRLYGNDYRVFERLSDDDVMRIIHGELSEEE